MDVIGFMQLTVQTATIWCNMVASADELGTEAPADDINAKTDWTTDWGQL